jgi:hypothetical protein
MLSTWQNGAVSQAHYHQMGDSVYPWHRLQFMSAGLSRCAVPTSIHCDHLIQAVDGAMPDLEVVSASSCTRMDIDALP